VRVAVVGPGHPQKGGVALHTSMLARQLADAGHSVVHVTWASAYPALLYPGELRVPGAPETAAAVRTASELRWWDPVGWRHTGDRVARADVVVLVHVAAVQAPALTAIAARCRRHGTPTVLVAHNVVAHEPRPGERLAVSRLLRAVDRVVVHTTAEGERARELGARDVVVTPLVPAFPDVVTATGGETSSPALRSPATLLAFGHVRPYKGVDLAVRGLAAVPGVRLLVAGEFWTPAAELRELAVRLGVDDRVELRDGYVDATDLPALFAEADVVVLPYRSATGSQQAALARAFGLPVVATRTGALAVDVHDDVDGLLVEVGHADAWEAAVRRVLEPATWARLASGARDRGADDVPWADYLRAVLG
jgi:glycosyltransferase involved in cell wall biosynthesis